jgi:TPP-dependent pyruvate/acetoin dehydrogenase alpha subunit
VIEGMTYRWYDHAGFAGGRVGQDAAMGLPYRSDEEVKQWMSRDPNVRFKAWIIAKGLAAEAELSAIEAKAQAAVDASIEFARKSADPNPEDGVLNTYANSAAAATQFYNRRNITAARTT